MKKVVGNLLVVVMASMYLLAKSLSRAFNLAYEELDPYIGTLSLIQMAVAICASVIGFGVLGVFMAVMR